MNRNNLLKRHFKPLARAAGLPKEATLYTLRHTFATLCLESGETLKILQEMLGHSRIDVTLNVSSRHRMTVYEYLQPASRGQCVTTFRHTAGKA